MNVEYPEKIFESKAFSLFNKIISETDPKNSNDFNLEIKILI